MRFFRTFLPAAALTVALATSVSAEDIGVAECDKFLKTFDACLVAKATPDLQSRMKAALDPMRANWKSVAATEDGKKQLAGVCKQTADTMKQQVAALNCTW